MVMKNKSTCWCWWCCHPFETCSLSMPVSYNIVTDIFEVYGIFCSFECMKAYNHNEHTANKMSQYSLISMLIAKTNINCESIIRCAPPRQMLTVFGGTMSITEFRKQFNTEEVYNLHLPNMIRVNHTIEKQNKSNFKWIKSSDDSSEKTYSIKEFEAKASVDRISNNAIKIKHNDKKKQINTLERVLGIFPNT
jgi:hypothetical protein